ncbi:MAG: DUF4124 domain-containing protein [Betaproteobacteria bacterium]
MKNIVFIAALLAAGAGVSLTAHADVYRCVAADGQTSYRDTPCPKDARSKSNISNEVGVCATAECEDQRRQAAADARERLRSDKEEAAALTSQRQADELTAERDRARVQAQRAEAESARLRASIDARMSAIADEAAEGAAYPLYPAYPVYPPRTHCGRHCAPSPQPTPDPAATPPHKREPSVRGRLD